MRAKFFTDQGKVRSHNEDDGGVFHNNMGQHIAIIADGMGGHKAGDVASQMAVAKVKEKWDDIDQMQTSKDAEAWLIEGVSEANEAIYHHSLEDKTCEGMGTTLVIAILTDHFVSVANVGDSRCYLLNENGFNQITEDHSLVNALVQSGQITKDDARYHPQKNVVLKALGLDQQVTADVKSLCFDEGDKLLLCSDGLTDKIKNEELEETIAQTENIEDAGRSLVTLANERGGEDNISLIIVNYDSLGAGES